MAHRIIIKITEERLAIHELRKKCEKLRGNQSSEDKAELKLLKSEIERRENAILSGEFLNDLYFEAQLTDGWGRLP